MTDELRKLEARMDARLQAVNARFAGTEHRHDSLSSQLGIAEDRWQAFAKSVDRRFGTVNDRDDATHARIDLVHDRLAAKIDELVEEAAKRRGRVLLYVAGVMGTTAAGLASLAVLLS